MPTGEPTDELRANVLLVDDDAPTLRSFRRCVEGAGHRVATASNSEEALAALGRQTVDICVLDVNLGEESGLDILEQIKQEAPWVRVVMATAEDDIELAVRSIKSGAADYLVKPCSPDQLLHAVRLQVEARAWERRLDQIDDPSRAELTFETRSPALRAVYDAARQVAVTDATILILGESGTGKSALARAIHGWSARRNATLATVSCPSLSPELLESELFGHVRGAFTGAVDTREGRVQFADGGTLFLDEIGDMPLSLQPKLLRFLQDQEYERLGDPRTRRADVRVVAATNRDLAQMVKTQSFREDLYYRLNVVALVMPPLRDRVEDVPLLCERMLLALAQRYHRPARMFTQQALEALCAYPWPGNLRELHNAIERAVILCPGESIGSGHLPFGKTRRGNNGSHHVGAAITLEALERAHIETVVATAPTLDEAARILGIDGSTLYRKRKQYRALSRE
ncbi:MAG TPA: sigma-54 dependent transcriptional regulator [Rhodanobacteraceae bacterium]|nr:sigma-54 dependent transcriptional regulator [Rhodanobacteraceae bacterium]